MTHRSALQHLLHSLRPSKGRADTVAAAPDFVDTQPANERAAAAQAARRRGAAPRGPVTWAESALDLEAGSEIMEVPDDAVADLMEEFFAKTEKKAA